MPRAPAPVIKETITTKTKAKAKAKSGVTSKASRPSSGKNLGSARAAAPSAPAVAKSELGNSSTSAPVMPESELGNSSSSALAISESHGLPDGLLQDIERSLKTGLEELSSPTAATTWPTEPVERLVACVGGAAEAARIALAARGEMKADAPTGGDWSECLAIWPWLLKLNLAVIDMKGNPAAAAASCESATKLALRLNTFLFDSLSLVGGGPAELLADLGRSAWKLLATVVQNWMQPSTGVVDEGCACLVSSLLAAFCRTLEISNLNEPGLIYRAIPVVAKCLALPTGTPALEAIMAAANTVVQTISLGGTSQIKGDLLEELVNVAPEVAVAPKEKGRPRKLKEGSSLLIGMQPTSHTRALLDVVMTSASCPNPKTARTGGLPSMISREDFEALREAWGLCEETAARVSTALVRRCLLSVSDKDDEKTIATWGRLEEVVKELLQLSSGIWSLPAAALLLTLAKAIARVACAPRSVSLVWTQREFAVKLLGQVAEEISKRSAPRRDPAKEVAGEGEPSLEFLAKVFSTELRSAFAKATEDTARTSQPQPDRHALECLILSELQQDEHTSAGRRLPKSCFLLAFLARREEQTGAQGQKQAKRARVKAKEPSTSSLGGAEEGLCKAWLHLSNIGYLGAKWTAANGKGHGKLKRAEEESVLSFAASSISAGLLHSEGSQLGLLARVRLVALEALQAQLAQSPLAFVRRSALAGLTASAEADREIVVSRPFTEALSVALGDTSPCVRGLAVELLGKMLLAPHQSLSPNHVAECRSAVLARMDDSASVVRRAAFKVTCTTLTLDTPNVADIMVNLFRRVKYEAASVRETVFSSLEKCTLGLGEVPKSKSGPKSGGKVPAGAFSCLVSLAMYPDVGGSAVLQLFKTHQQAQSEPDFRGVMDCIVKRALEELAALVKGLASEAGEGEARQLQQLQQKQLSQQQPQQQQQQQQEQQQQQQQQFQYLAAWGQILKQVSIVHPSGLHGELPRLQAWLKAGASEAAEAVDLFMAQKACSILSNIVPSFCVDQKKDQNQLGKTRAPLLSLLKEQGSGLTRAAAQAFCLVSARLGSAEAKDDVHKLAKKCISDVEAWTSRRVKTNSSTAHQTICRTLWTLATILEFAEPNGDWPLEDVAVKSFVQTLAAAVIQGTEAIRPVAVPCLGFVLRRHFGLLNQVYPVDCSPLQAFKAGLSDSKNQALGARTAEALSGLLESYEGAADEGLEMGSNWGETVAAAMGKPKICEVVQSLATLQPVVLKLLRETASEPTAAASLSALASLSRLGVLHISGAMPDLIAASLTGPSSLLPEVKHLLLKLADHSPSLLLTRLAPGLRIAVQQFSLRLRPHLGPALSNPKESAGQGQGPGQDHKVAAALVQLLGSRNRYALLAELYANQIEHRRGDKFLDILLNEFQGATQVGDVSDPLDLLLRTGLLYGTFAHFAYRTEADLSKVFTFAAKFVQLKVGSFLLLSDNAQSTIGKGTPTAAGHVQNKFEGEERKEQMEDNEQNEPKEDQEHVGGAGEADDDNDLDGENAGEDQLELSEATSLNVPNVVVSVVLHSLCTHLATHLGPAVSERLLSRAAGGAAEGDGLAGAEARPLPPSFLRRAPPGEADGLTLFSSLNVLMEANMSTSNNCGNGNGRLLQFLRGRISLESPLLRLGSALHKKTNHRRAPLEESKSKAKAAGKRARSQA